MTYSEMNLEMPSRSLKRVYHLDANRINARQNDCYVNQLEKWHKTKVIFLEMSRIAYDEAGRGSFNRLKKSDKYTWVNTNDTIGGEKDFKNKIEVILFPKGCTKPNQENDIWILFTAHRAEATLVTEDGDSNRQPCGILGSKRALAALGIKVLSTRDVVTEIMCLINERDQKAREVAKRINVSIPNWVGLDSNELGT